MYTEVVSLPIGVSRLRKAIDPDKKYFSDETFAKILTTTSFILGRAAVKSFLALEQKAKEKKDSKTVAWARNMRLRYENDAYKI